MALHGRDLLHYENRINKLKTQEVMNQNLINKAKRQLRKIQKDN